MTRLLCSRPLWVAGALALMIVGVLVPRSVATAGSRSDATYRSPVGRPLIVLRPFVAPTTRYGPGHRGVDLALATGADVLAAGSGRVTFAGVVAGRGVVVLSHPDGLSTEYEPVRPVVRVGDQVSAGAEIAVLEGVHVGCARSCLHWGARRGGTYLDPMQLLQPLGAVVLLPS